MAKNLKINIKNTQIAEAINLKGIKDKLAKKKSGASKDAKKETKKKEPKGKKAEVEEIKAEGSPEVEQEAPKPRVKARSRSAFETEARNEEPLSEVEAPSSEAEVVEEPVAKEEPETEKASPPPAEEKPKAKPEEPPRQVVSSIKKGLGPTGRHINDLLPTKKEVAPKPSPKPEKAATEKEEKSPEEAKEKKPAVKRSFAELDGGTSSKKDAKTPKFSVKKRMESRSRKISGDDEGEVRYRKPKTKLQKPKEEIAPDRPAALHVRLPISIKDLAAQMKLKASQLIQKLFMQGAVCTLNDLLDDETTIQLLGHEFECEITIDTSEERRLRITDESVEEEIRASDAEELLHRPPVITFMGHVDHGKTSLIDRIRKSNLAAGEAGAITQHIGAFYVKTATGDVSVLDTPGHAAFSAMRARGADVTDIVVLVVAGDEGLRQQTLEAIQHARAAKKTIIVAVNKCDKPNFDIDTIYRQLADQELLPEAWGGSTIAIKCSAQTGEGIPELLEMISLQSEVLELKANPKARARGRVVESEMHKGMGAVATVLIQNGTLKHGDPLVIGCHWGRVKTMKNDSGTLLDEAGPSHPVEITGLSSLPEAGEEFIVVSSEKEAREIAETRMDQFRESQLLLKKKTGLENLLLEAADSPKKVLNVVLRADVQGSLEALKAALLNINSDKVNLEIIFSGIGEISESDIQLASASKAVVIGFHTGVESHAESLIKSLKVPVKTFDIIYHAIDGVKELMASLLDKVGKEEHRGEAEVRQTFKVSRLGVIAGCYVTEGTIHRNHRARVHRDGEVLWQGYIDTLKRVKDDVKEVNKGFECGILLKDFNDIQEGDKIETYEIMYYTQEL